MNKEISLNEAVNLLYRTSSASLSDLKKRFPNDADLLKEGQQLGSESSKNEVLIAVSVAAMKAAEIDATRAIDSVKKRIQRAKTWQISAQFFAAILAFASAMVDTSIEKTLTALASAISSLAGLAAEKLLAIVDSKQGSAAEIFTKMIALREQVRILNRQALVIDLSIDSTKSSVELFSTVNTVAAQLNELSAQI